MVASSCLFLCLFLGQLLHGQGQHIDAKIAYEGEAKGNQVAFAAQPTGTNSAYEDVYQIVRGNSGVAAMHMIVNCQGNLLIVDRWNGEVDSNLPVCGEDETVDGSCRVVHKQANGRDAHAVLWDLKTNKITDYIDTMTNTFCSSGGVASDGKVLVLGGSKEGVDTIRSYGNGGEEMEVVGKLNSARWYSTWENLADGRGVLVGGQHGLDNPDGSNNPSLEYYPKEKDGGEYKVKTLEEGAPENLYPFVYTLPDGKLFILGRWLACKWDPQTNTEERLDDIPGAGRSYHASGTSVLLPLLAAEGFKAEVLVCGGGSQVRQGPDTPATDSCGRICVFGCGDGPLNQWDMSDTMPSGRHMSTAVLLPSLNVVIVGGMGTGLSGYYREGGRPQASDPQYEPALYQTYGKKGARFSPDVASKIPRSYHSAAVLLPDATVAIAGSNENTADWRFENVRYPTEFRIESYSPPYLRRNLPRPVLNALPNAGRMFWGMKYTITGTARASFPGAMRVVIVSSGWSTHGYNQAQRLVIPAADFTLKGNTFSAVVTIPANKNVLPPSCYLMFVVFKASPSVGLPVRIG